MNDEAASRSGWQHFDHGADIGIRGFGATVGAAFEQAAVALTAVMTDPAKVGEERTVTIECGGSDLDDLFFAWLSRLVLEMSTEDLVFARFSVVIEGTVLTATAWGEPLDRRKHAAAVEIKGPTYTGLRVFRDDTGRWIAQCVVDV